MFALITRMASGTGSRDHSFETGGSITPFLRSGLGLDVVTDRLRLWITTRCRNRPGAVPSRLRLISGVSLSSTCFGVLLSASIWRKRSADLSPGVRNAPKRMCATIGGMLSKMTCTCPPRNTVMAAFAPRSGMAAHRPIPPAARREHVCGLLWLFVVLELMRICVVTRQTEGGRWPPRRPSLRRKDNRWRSRSMRLITL